MIDTHCHLADDDFEGQVEAVVDRARAAGVSTCLCILDATRPDEHVRARALMSYWPDLWFAIGIHPHRAAAADLSELALPEAIDVSRVVALGEIGLDYHYDFSPQDVQREVFRRQLVHARGQRWPVVIHCREAEDDVIEAIRTEGAGELTGVFHCFTGDTAMARRVLDLGFHLSFSGIVTFPKATAIAEAAQYCPMERLLVETDSPFLAPVPHRGKRNEPSFVSHVVDRVAGLRGVAREVVVEAVRTNFATLFTRTVVQTTSR